MMYFQRARRSKNLDVPCWVPSEAGKPFRIGYSAFTRGGHGLKVSVLIDGELAAEQTHAPPQRRQGWTVRDGVRGMKDGFGSERPFYFSKRSITDNDLDTVSESTLKTLGSIQVRFQWIDADPSSLSERPCSNLSRHVSTHSLKHNLSVFEEQVKHNSGAFSHAAGLGVQRKLESKWWSAKKSPARRRASARVGLKDVLRPVRWSEVRDLRYTIFEFKHAPAAYLEAEGILHIDSPPTSDLPTPSPGAGPSRSPWRSYVGTPYRELRADSSFPNATPHPIGVGAGSLLFRGDSGLDFNTPTRPVKLGSHLMTNYTSFAPLGNHMIVHPQAMAPLVKLETKREPTDGEIKEITADEFYGREVIDLTGLDSDDE